MSECNHEWIKVGAWDTGAIVHVCSQCRGLKGADVTDPERIIPAHPARSGRGVVTSVRYWPSSANSTSEQLSSDKPE